MSPDNCNSDNGSERGIGDISVPDCMNEEDCGDVGVPVGAEELGRDEDFLNLVDAEESNVLEGVLESHEDIPHEEEEEDELWDDILPDDLEDEGGGS